MNGETEVFLAKLDEFAQSLSPTEQAMFAHLIQDDPDAEDDVAGFALIDPWPTNVAQTFAPLKVQQLGMFDSFLPSGPSVRVSGPISSGDLGSGRREG